MWKDPALGRRPQRVMEELESMTGPSRASLVPKIPPPNSGGLKCAVGLPRKKFRADTQESLYILRGRPGSVVLCAQHAHFALLQCERVSNRLIRSRGTERRGGGRAGTIGALPTTWGHRGGARRPAHESANPQLMASNSIIRETLRALMLPRRLVPIVLVCVPLVIAQGSFSKNRLAIPLAILMCIAFVFVAPLSWRILLPEDREVGQTTIRLLLYAGFGAGVVLVLGVVIPQALGIGATFLTQRPSLAVSGALFLVGGWGLARDIGLEASLSREKARAAAFAREAEQAHLLALRAHLDPHFLFNTLNAIAEWCRQDGETAERAVLQLSSILRILLQGVKSPTWPLEKELELSRTIFSLHQMRDPSAFTLEWDIPDHLESVPVPPMLLLPLAENAITHGPTAGHHGAIRCSAKAEGAVLRLVLENPGPYKGPRVGSDGIPMVERRLALAYGGKARFRIQGIGERTTVELELPIRGPESGVAV